MMNILFIFSTLFCIAGVACLLNVFYTATRPGQILGGWGEHLMELEREGHLFLSKAGGMCEICYSFWFNLLLLPLYFIVVDLPFPLWGSIVWVLFYHSISTIVTLKLITNEH